MCPSPTKCRKDSSSATAPAPSYQNGQMNRVVRQHLHSAIRTPRIWLRHTLYGQTAFRSPAHVDERICDWRSYLSLALVGCCGVAPVFGNLRHGQQRHGADEVYQYENLLLHGGKYSVYRLILQGMKTFFTIINLRFACPGPCNHKADESTHAALSRNKTILLVDSQTVFFYVFQLIYVCMSYKMCNFAAFFEAVYIINTQLTTVFKTIIKRQNESICISWTRSTVRRHGQRPLRQQSIGKRTFR